MKTILVVGAACSAFASAAGFICGAAGAIDAGFGLYCGVIGGVMLAYFMHLLNGSEIN
jgi:hypothetical protein